MRERRIPAGIAAWAGALALLSEVGSVRAQEAPPTIERVSLNEAIHRAATRSVSSMIASEEIRRFEALAVEVRSGWLPTLYGTGTYTRLDGDRVFGGGGVIAPQDSLSGNLTLSVPVVHPQKWAAWSHAKDAVDIARMSEADVGRQVALATGRAYLAVLAQKRALDVVNRARDTAKAHYEFARARLAGGVGNRIDEVRAAQELATDEAQVRTTDAGLVRTREALGVLMGADTAIDVLDDPGLAEPPSLAAGLSDARSKRADVKVGEKRIEATGHAVRDDWTDHSPYLVGVFQPFYQNPPNLTQPLTGWQAQLILTIPFYDGGLRYGLAKERSSLDAEAKILLENTLRQAKSDVRASFEALQRADEALLAARQAADLARQALELANLAYRAGATTNLEVIDAERRARDAETQAVVNEDNARQARLDLLSAAGRFP